MRDILIDNERLTSGYGLKDRRMIKRRRKRRRRKEIQWRQDKREVWKS